MINIEQKEIWFVTGSQHLYGEETLKQVAANSRQIVEGLKNSSHIPVRVICQDTVKTSDEIAALFLRANAENNCIGIMAWMHTFSPAKMWIRSEERRVGKECRSRW